MIDHRISRTTRKRCGTCKFAVIDVTHVGREAARNLISQAQLKLSVCEASPPLPCTGRLVGSVQFDLGFENEALGQVQVILGFQSNRGARLFSDVACEFDVEPIGCNALHAKCCPLTARAAAEIMPDPELSIPERENCVRPKCFYF